MNAAMSSANWNWPPGAPGVACAQASGIKAFMYAVREAKRAALCHSTGGAPACEESPGPDRQIARGDGGAQRAHEPNVEVQVVDGVEPRAQDLVAAVEMAQVGTTVVAAGVTVAGGVDRRENVLGVAVADGYYPGRGEQVPVAGVTRRHDTVEQVDAAHHGRHDVLRPADAHEMTRQSGRHVRHQRLEGT